MRRAGQTSLQTFFVIQLGEREKESNSIIQLINSCLTNHWCLPEEDIKEHVKEEQMKKLTSIQTSPEINWSKI